MSAGSKKRDEAEEAVSFFNRGRRYTTEIIRDNELLRSKIRRLEQALRGTIDTGRRSTPRGALPCAETETGQKEGAAGSSRRDKAR